VKYIYLGGFPPPYGGVTIKNHLLFTELKQHIEIQQSRFYNMDYSPLARMFWLCKELLSNDVALVIGVSKGSFKKLTSLLFLINKTQIKNSIVMIMGGTASQMIAEDIRLQKCVKEYKHIYVETNGMKEILCSNGIKNVSIFPNCRKKPNKGIAVSKNYGSLRCVFFSLVSKEKGADILNDAAKLLVERNIDFTIDFFGHIEDEYKKEFNISIESTDRVHYCGVFESDKENVYEKLNQYDVLLFPTRWKTEGVPGVLVEAKIAALPAIVSNVSFNAEIIEDGKNGMVLTENSSVELANAIECLYYDRDLLMEMKKNAKISGEEYLIENYIDDIVEMINCG
jgi:glycosyltransferase involved in cell wall biosynthesis